jgi:Fe2+ or Zn2+ uptake regulation protein
MTERRNTRQRQLVLEEVRSRHDHPTAEQIFDEVHKVDEHLSRATVYRNLHLLADEGIILSIKAPGGDFLGPVPKVVGDAFQPGSCPNSNRMEKEAAIP